MSRVGPLLMVPLVVLPWAIARWRWVRRQRHLTVLSTAWRLRRAG